MYFTCIDIQNTYSDYITTIQSIYYIQFNQCQYQRIERINHNMHLSDFGFTYIPMTLSSKMQIKILI